MPKLVRSGWDELLTRSEVAQLLRVHVNTLQNWSQRGIGPRETRIGILVRYAESDVQRWLAERKREGQLA